MEGANVQMIIDTVKSRTKAIKRELSEREIFGLWPRPVEVGWSPCDHGMVCATLAETGGGRRVSVMRASGLKTRAAMETASMATDLWEGSWDDLIMCPRKHEEVVPESAMTVADSLTTEERRSRLSPKKRANAESGPGTDRSTSTVTGTARRFRVGFTPMPDEDPEYEPPALANARVSRPSSKKSTGYGLSLPQHPSSVASVTQSATSSLPKRQGSPAKNLWHPQTQTRIKVEDASGFDLTDPESVPCAPGPATISGRSESSGHSSYRTVSAGARSSGTNSSRGIVRIRRQAERLASTGLVQDAASDDRQPDPFGTKTCSTVHERRGLLTAVFEFLGGSDAAYFFLQQLIRAVWFSLLLVPFLQFAQENITDLSDLSASTNRLMLGGSLSTALVGAQAMESALDTWRRYVWRKWGVEVSPPEGPHLSATAYFLLIFAACGLAFYICTPLAHHVKTMLNMSLPWYAALRVKSPRR